MAEDNARTVQKTEIRKAYKFGGEQVLFTLQEQKELKNFGPPVLRIIGFKPQSMLPAWASINKATFIYPSEEDYVGSTRVFAALWQKLLKDKKMGLAWYIGRLNAKPQIVAVLPSQERLDDHTKQQVSPAGLWLYPLPYADDLRSPPEVPAPVVSPDKLIDQMRVVVQQLQLPGAMYEPSRYPNPALQWHYRILQAIALEEEVPEFKDGDDKTIPKYRQIDKRAGGYVIDWGVELEERCRERQTHKSSSSGAGIKREAGESAGGPTKKAKVGSAKLEDLTVAQLKLYVEEDKIGKSTVPELKGWLLAKGLSTGGNKSVLVERIEQWVENH